MSTQRPPAIADGVGGFRFAANLKWLFTHVPWEQRFTLAAEHGFRAVEVPSPYDFSIGAVSRLLGDAGLDLAAMNTPPRVVGGSPVTGIAGDPALRADFRAGVEQGLEYAAGLGTTLLHVVAGPRPQTVSAEHAWGEYLDNISWAVDAAEGTDITLLIEPQNQRSSPGFLLTTQAQAREVIESIGSSRLKILFDVFHVQVQEGDVTAKWRELAPLVGHIQVADAPDRTEPGTGELSWSHLFGEFAAAGYSGWIGCEYSPTQPQGAHIDWLKQIGVEHGG